MATESQKRATQKYKEKNKGKFVEMRFKVSVEERNQIKTYCDEHGIAVSDFVRKLVFDAINKQQ